MDVETPFRLAGGAQPLILIPARVNGSPPAPFILDTGAGVCLLSPRLARRAAVDVASLETAMGAAGPLEVGLATAGSLAVGEARVEAVPVAVTDELERIGRVVGAPIEGDLGYGFLRHFRLTIDYRRERLLFACGREPSTEGRGSPAVAFRIADPARPLLLLPVRVNGEGPFVFALDTGASSSVVSPELARELGIEGRRAVKMTGGGGKVAAFSGSAASIAVGPAVCQGVDVMIGPFLEPLGQAVGTRLDGVLGYNFLRQFRVTIDYPGLALELAPA